MAAGPLRWRDGKQAQSAGRLCEGLYLTVSDRLFCGTYFTIHRFMWRWSAKVSRWMLSGSKTLWPETNKSCFTVTAGYPEEHFLRRTEIGKFSS